MKVLTVKTGVWEARVLPPLLTQAPEPKLKAARKCLRPCSHKILGPARVCAWGVRALGGMEKENDNPLLYSYLGHPYGRVEPEGYWWT